MFHAVLLNDARSKSTVIREHRGKNRWALSWIGDTSSGSGHGQTEAETNVGEFPRHPEAGRRQADRAGADDQSRRVRRAVEDDGREVAHHLARHDCDADQTSADAPTYRSVITGTLIPALGPIQLQALTALDLQALYASKKRAPKTLHLYHCVMGAALKSAVKQGLLTRNVASLVEGLPRVERTSDEIEANCWGRDEARTFLAAVQAPGPRQSAPPTPWHSTAGRASVNCAD